MDLPMGVVPVDEALHIERDGSEGNVFQGGDVVAPRGLRSAPALGQPVLIELDVNLAARRPQGQSVANVVAVHFAIRIHGPAIDGSEPVRTVAAIEGVRVQIHPMNLDKGRDALAGHVRDGARREELPLVRNAACGGTRPVAASEQSLIGIRRTEYIADRDQVGGTRDVRIPGGQATARERAGGAGSWAPDMRGRDSNIQTPGNDQDKNDSERDVPDSMRTHGSQAPPTPGPEGRSTSLRCCEKI